MLHDRILQTLCLCFGRWPVFCKLKSFQFPVNELVRNAEDENIDGAPLAFTQMTISCVNCHKAVRKE